MYYIAFIAVPVYLLLFLFRKLAKSTLILIPLFGVYYLAFIAVPVCMEPMLEVIWLYTEMFFNSFQVSLLTIGSWPWVRLLIL